MKWVFIKLHAENIQQRKGRKVLLILCFIINIHKMYHFSYYLNLFTIMFSVMKTSISTKRQKYVIGQLIRHNQWSCEIGVAERFVL